MTLLLTLDDGSVQRKLADAVEFARAAVLEDAPEEQLGAHVGVTREDAVTASHLFEAQVPGYGGWRWSVTVALAGDDEPVTVSEVVLVPGPDALVAPAWVPWERRVRAGDLGVGDIFPTDENDPRLAPAYLQSDDPAVEEVSREAGLGRVHVLSRFGRTEAASRWHAGEFGPRSDMARSAPDVCGTCGFFVPLAGSLRGVFGVCSNDIAPADGHVVDVEYGCGAHSEVEVEVTSSVPVAELVYDDSLLDYAPAPEVVETAAAEPETGIAESDLSPAEVEPEVATEPAAEDAGGSVGAAGAVDSAGAVAEPVADESVVAEAGAEPVEAAEAPEEVTSEVTEPVAAVNEPVEIADGPVAEEASAEVAEPGEVEASVVAEPVEAAEVTEPAVEANEIAEPGESQASVIAEPVEASAEAVASEATDEVTEPVVAEVPEPAEAEPTQAEVTDAIELQASPEPLEASTESEAAEVPAAAESDAAEVDPLPTEVADLIAEPVPSQAAVPEPADAEPTQAEVTDAVATPEPAEAAPVQAEAPEAAAAETPEAEVPEAVLTDNVVPAEPEPETPEADEAQAQVDNAPER
jgi:hypothetical protein